MKKILFILAILFLLMIVINEFYRLSFIENSNTNYNLRTINPRLALKQACTWECYHNTSYCKKNHVKLLRPYFSYIDPIYYGIIKILHKGGGYVVSNVIYLVIIWPMLMAFLLYKVITLRKQSKI
jgi:hypothetical protein